MDTNRQEIQKRDEQEEAKDQAKPEGLGRLLRSERIKRGLSSEQVAKIIRFRTQMIEALENEEWENLPPPVFVKGIIKAYSKALGIEKGKILDLIKKTESLKTTAPKPLMERKEGKKYHPFWIVLLLCIVSVVLYLWRTNPSLLRVARFTQEGIQSNLVIEEPRPFVEAEKAPEKEMPLSSETPIHAKEGVEENTQVAEKAVPLVDEGLVAPPKEVQAPQPEAQEAQTETRQYTLTATVTQRTWLKVYLDDESPREYLLQPESRLQWKAKTGFNIVIGNAAGIEFEFDGKTVEKRGKTGQVMRISLPEGFRSKKYEE